VVWSGALRRDGNRPDTVADLSSTHAVIDASVRREPVVHLTAAQRGDVIYSLTAPASSGHPPRVERAAQPTCVRQRLARAVPGRVFPTDHDRIAHLWLAAASFAATATVPRVERPRIEHSDAENNRRACESRSNCRGHPPPRRRNLATRANKPNGFCGAGLFATAVLRCVPRHFGQGERLSRGSLIHSAGRIVPQLPQAIPEAFGALMLLGPPWLSRRSLSRYHL
jgi:hypothetical protein